MDDTPRSASGFRDRSFGLAVFGTIEILIGLALAALVPLVVVALVLSRAVTPVVASASAVLYGALATLFIALGVGSIRCRRWARELSLSMGWLWLVTGVCTMVLTWLLAPGLGYDLAVLSGLAGSAARSAAVGITVLSAVIYVLLPAAFVLFYGSAEVAATCRHRDPEPDWAERCPQPLLSLAVAFALGGLSVLAMPAYGFVFPLFGRLLAGADGAVAWGLVLVLAIVLAWGTWRRAHWAWWLAAAASAAAAVSTALTFATTDAETVLAAMKLAPEQRRLIEPLWPQSPWVQVVGWTAVWGSLLGYLLFVRPLYGRPSRPARKAEL